MEFAHEVAEILSHAERKLRELTAHALERRDYLTVQRLSAIAERVATAGEVDGVRQPTSPAVNQRSALPASSGQVGRLDRSSPSMSAAVVSSAEVKPYPRFSRDENQLVKIGYSRSERRTYEHRSPREVLDRLGAVLADLGTEGRKFVTDQILPPAEPRLADVPSYQVYLCLAFLIRRGLVRRHGRSGYTVECHRAADLPTAVKAAWEALPGH